MATGACGINCDTCRLRLLGTCSTCGPGTSAEAERKLDAQKRIFGGSCAVLECAVLKRVAYCPRDCDMFPCENFSDTAYPYSPSFLAMQQRRRRELPPALDPNGRPIEVSPELWESLGTRDIDTLCNLTLFEPDGAGGLRFVFLSTEIRIVPERACLLKKDGERWIETDDPMLELVVLLYLSRIESLHPLGREIVGAQDLNDAVYFSGRQELRTQSLLERYAGDMDGFRQSAEALGGKPVDMADAGYALTPFPRIPIYYLLWGGDREYASRMSILFDRSIEHCLDAPGIWALVSRVTIELLRGSVPDMGQGA